jgi:hypothetical protein
VCLNSSIVSGSAPGGSNTSTGSPGKMRKEKKRIVIIRKKMPVASANLFNMYL